MMTRYLLLGGWMEASDVRWGGRCEPELVDALDRFRVASPFDQRGFARMSMCFFNDSEVTSVVQYPIGTVLTPVADQDVQRLALAEPVTTTYIAPGAPPLVVTVPVVCVSGADVDTPEPLTDFRHLRTPTLLAAACIDQRLSMAETGLDLGWAIARCLDGTE